MRSSRKFSSPSLESGLRHTPPKGDELFGKALCDEHRAGQVWRALEPAKVCDEHTAFLRKGDEHCAWRPAHRRTQGTDRRVGPRRVEKYTRVVCHETVRASARDPIFWAPGGDGNVDVGMCGDH